MTERPRCVVDTNILISAYLSPQGTPRRVFDWIAREGVFLASEETLFEFADRFVGRKKFDRYLDPSVRARVVLEVAARAHLVQVTTPLSGVAKDPDDDPFLALAVDGEADYLVTGNTKDFPATFRGIEIVTAAQFADSHLS